MNSSLLTIINYVRENRDIKLEDRVNTELLNDYGLNEMFGVHLAKMAGMGCSSCVQLKRLEFIDV